MSSRLHPMRNCPYRSSALPGKLGIQPTCPQCIKIPAKVWQGGGAPDRLAEYDQIGRRKRRKSKKRKSKKRKSKKRKSRTRRRRR